MDTIQLQQFREELYRALPRRADATMDLVDALSANTHARSVVELSLAPQFRRGHPSVHDAIDALQNNPGHSPIDGPRRNLEGKLLSAVASQVQAPARRGYYLVAVDGFTVARPHARTLADRGYVHTVEGSSLMGRPVTVGHTYSLLVHLPERGPKDPPWAPGLSSRRIPSGRSASDVGVEQLWDILGAKDVPWAGQLVVCCIDSGYGNAPFLADAAKEPNLVAIARFRSNRVLYRSPPPRQSGQRGRTPSYGERFDLGKAVSWHEPDAIDTFQRQTHRGRTLTVTVRAWHDMLMKGSRAYPMHAHPFTLLRIECRSGGPDAERVHPPMWLAVVGDRRRVVSPEQGYDDYRQRFDQEHSHRFLRQRLLLDASQTPETQHEENWIQIVRLAYVQLFAARHVAQALPRPWEKAVKSTGPLSPTMVQRDLGRILATIGTPACAPKPRGKSPGRLLGDSPGLRKRRPVVFKGHSTPQRARAPTG